MNRNPTHTCFAVIPYMQVAKKKKTVEKGERSTMITGRRVGSKSQTESHEHRKLNFKPD